MPFPNVELLLVTWLKTELNVRVVTDTPANLATILPVVQVTRFGGSDNDVVLDRATVDIDVYAATRNEALTLAERVREAMLFRLTGSHPGAVVARVQTVAGPAWRPYDNSALRRFGAVYSVTLHATS